MYDKDPNTENQEVLVLAPTKRWHTAIALILLAALPTIVITSADAYAKAKPPPPVTDNSPADRVPVPPVAGPPPPFEQFRGKTIKATKPFCGEKQFKKLDDQNHRRIFDCTNIQDHCRTYTRTKALARCSSSFDLRVRDDAPLENKWDLKGYRPFKSQTCEMREIRSRKTKNVLNTFLYKRQPDGTYDLINKNKARSWWWKCETVEGGYLPGDRNDPSRTNG